MERAGVTARPMRAGFGRTLVAVAVTAMLAGCSPGRGGTAESIAAAVAQLPGVASSTFDYESGWPRGDEHFTLTAVLRDNATPDQAYALGKTFSDRVKAQDFTGFERTLVVKYRVTDRMNDVPLSTVATFTDPDAVAESLRGWLAVAQSPGIQSVTYTQSDQAMDITVAPDATDAALRELARAQPDVDRAEWLVVGGSLTETSPFAADHPEVYRVRGRIPDAALRDLWVRIVAEVGAAGVIAASTDSARDIPTAVDLNFPTARDREQNLAQAWMVLPLLQKLPLPATVNFDGAVFVMGGCSDPDPSRNVSPTEVELRRKYETC